MRRAQIPPTLIIGYDQRVEELLSEFMSSVPTMRDFVFSLHYKPKAHDMLNVKIMSPFVYVPFPHILDVLDPFNVKNLSGFEVAIIATEDEATLRTGLLLKDLGVDTYVYMGDESVEIEEVVEERPEGERIPRVINGLYVIPGYGKRIMEEEFKRVGSGFITNTGCVVAPSYEEALRILNEQSI